MMSNLFSPLVAPFEDVGVCLEYLCYRWLPYEESCHLQRGDMGSAYMIVGRMSMWGPIFTIKVFARIHVQ